MKKIIIFLFSLIFLIGCGTSEQDKEIEIDNLQEIDGKIYEYGEEKPYSGKIIIKNENDKVVMIETAKYQQKIKKLLQEHIQKLILMEM